MTQIIHSVWKTKLSGQARRPNEQFAQFNVSREELETLLNKPRALATLVYLRLNMPPSQFCAPSMATSLKMGWSQNTLIDALKVLTEHGFIERIGTKNVSDYPQDAIVYRFL